jgi:hypothetical protein
MQESRRKNMGRLFEETGTAIRTAKNPSSVRNQLGEVEVWK